MIIVQATMWPNGNQLESYEILNATITTQSSPGDEEQDYFAHVLARPKPFDGIAGYDADVEVIRHNPRNGFAPLLIAILGQAHAEDFTGVRQQTVAGVPLPETRQLARLNLVEPHQFEAMLRRGAAR